MLTGKEHKYQRECALYQHEHRGRIGMAGQAENDKTLNEDLEDISKGRRVFDDEECYIL